MNLTVMMACGAGWWFWWLYRRGETHQKSLDGVCQWMDDQYANFQDNPYSVLFGTTSINPAILTVRQQIQEALFAGYDLETPLRELYRTLRRLRLELYARQQVLRLFCLHQLLLLAIALVAKYILFKEGFLSLSSNSRSEEVEFGICLLAVGSLTAWMHTRVPTIWAWKNGWTQEALTWMQQLFQGAQGHTLQPSLASCALPNWVEQRFLQYEVAQKQFASSYPFYELSAYFLLLGGVFGRALLEGGHGISL
jgi:hypothetical protein